MPRYESKYSENIKRSSDIEKRDASLTELRVRSLSDSEINQLIKFQKLSYLNFGGGGEAKITDTGLKNLSELNLSNLKWLMLGYCQNITDDGLKHVAEINTLTHLSLMECQQITDNGLRNLYSLLNLWYLDLRGCKHITDQGLLYLTNMPGLRRISLGGCDNITQEGIEEARLKLPNCKIVKDENEYAQHQKARDQMKQIINNIMN